jgi:hypothetical protein
VDGAISLKSHPEVPEGVDIALATSIAWIASE